MQRSIKTVLARLTLEINTWHKTKFSNWHTQFLFGKNPELEVIEKEIAIILKSKGKEGLQPSDVEAAYKDKELPTFEATFIREWKNGSLSKSILIDLNGEIQNLHIEHFGAKGDNHVQDRVEFNQHPYEAICNGDKFLDWNEQLKATSAYFPTPKRKLETLEKCIKQFDDNQPGSQQALDKRESAISNALDLIGTTEGFILKTIQSYQAGYVELNCIDGNFGERFAKCLSQVDIKFAHHHFGFDKMKFNSEHTNALVSESDLIKLVRQYTVRT